MKNSFWQIFRLIFVIFSLYLMGDAFYRWDGFSFYATFSDFLPAVALVSILWSCVAVLLALIAFVLFKIYRWILHKFNCDISTETFIFIAFTFALACLTMWLGKRVLMPESHALVMKISLVLGAFFCTGFLYWLLRGKINDIIAVVQVRITPLVWIFILIIFVSLPVVVYHSMGERTDNYLAADKVASYTEAYKKPNIILVTFDALTARNMSAYGYKRKTTPFIDEWARKSYFFKMLEAESNATYPTTMSLITGRRVWSHNAYHAEGFKSEENIDNLAALLQNHGYFNVMYTGNKFATPKSWSAESHFDIIKNIGAFKMNFSVLGMLDEVLYKLFVDRIRLYNWIIKEDFLLYNILLAASPKNYKKYLSPEKTFADFIQAVDNKLIPEPFFVWFHFYPPHLAYVPPSPFMGTYNSTTQWRSAKIQEMEIHSLTQKYSLDPEKCQETVDILKDRYDESIKFCDKHFGDFIERFEKRDIAGNSIVVFSSDHGESFAHGYLGHGREHLYEDVTHIPLIIKDYRNEDFRQIHDVVEQIDIPPTLLELADISIPSWMEGQSLVPLMRGETLETGYAFAMNLDRNPSDMKITKGTIAVWDGDYKLIHYLDDESSLLFNLQDDPAELKNLIDIEPEKGRELVTIIRRHLQKANKRLEEL